MDKLQMDSVSRRQKSDNRTCGAIVKWALTLSDLSLSTIQHITGPSVTSRTIGRWLRERGPRSRCWLRRLLISLTYITFLYIIVNSLPCFHYISMDYRIIIFNVIQSNVSQPVFLRNLGFRQTLLSVYGKMHKK